MAKLRKLSVVVDEEKYSELLLLTVLYKHLAYSFKDINSYNELTEEEKKIIPKEMFEYLAEKENNICGYTMTCTNGIFNFCTMTKHFKSLRKAIEKAKEVAAKNKAEEIRVEKEAVAYANTISKEYIAQVVLSENESIAKHKQDFAQEVLKIKSESAEKRPANGRQRNLQHQNHDE